MHYVEVWVISNKYHGLEPLTYACPEPLDIGTIVLVPMRNSKVSGIVAGPAVKPSFKAKAVIGVQVSKPLPGASLELLTWLMKYYPAPVSYIASLFLPSNLLTSKLHEAAPPHKQQVTPAEELPPLTKQQVAALKALALQPTGASLIHGATGTGKTRLYIELALQKLKTGKTCLILTPEIGLTSQLADDLRRQLSAPVLVLHSNLTGLQRRNLWLQILFATEPLVIVGPRSALFAPISNLGLVVIDEAHDNSYKQDQLPHYSSLRVAGKLASIHQAVVVFGSATPLVSEYYIMSAKELPIIRLTEIAAGDLAPSDVVVVDARERSGYTRNPYLSNKLLTALESNLEKGEQSLVFLNRRGTARAVLCQTCGWQALCPNCNVPLTYHGDNHSLRCHTCGHKETSPTSCPKCDGLDIIYKTIGTKALVSTLESLFPHARIQRFDTDNTRQERLENHYQAVKQGDVDILVGTQMLVKGLDLPKLSLVGVVAADSSLQFPDYTAEEQTYQLLSQVMGRVGRGHRAGSVVIQTHNPDDNSLKAVLNKNWDEFYKQQIDERQRFMFPPFCYLLKLSCSRKSQNSAIEASKKLRLSILKIGLKVEVVGPSPRFIEQSNGNYNWQLIVKAKDRSHLLAIIPTLPANWGYDLDPTNLL